ncbi:alpha/beta hydrolase family protein [Wolbachia endosymbiont of Protocalliphora sialia]
MKVIYHTIGNIKPEETAKHVINFFGVLQCIKVNALGKDAPKEQESKLVKHYFDYPYFSRIINPEFFQKELNDEERKFNRIILSLWLCSAILSTASIISLYLAYQNQKSKKVLIELAFASVVLPILATICVIILCLSVFFDFVKKRFVIHRIKSFLENEVSPEWIKCYKKELIGEDQEIDVEACDQKLEKDMEDIIEFLFEKKKIIALYNFLTNGEKLVQAGMAMVNMLLVKGVHPNDIILDTNSLGEGVAAEVLKRFEDQGIHLTLIHSNSYSSLKDAVRDSPHSLVKWLPLMLLNRWFGRCGLDFNPQKVVENTKCPVLIAGRKGDTVIPQEIQLVGKLEDQSTKKRLIRNIVFEHDPAMPCENKNIHTDHKEHLVCRKDNDNATRHEEEEEQFIEEAHEYLLKGEFNKNFNLGDYRKSSISRNLMKIELKLVNEKPIQV